MKNRLNFRQIEWFLVSTIFLLSIVSNILFGFRRFHYNIPEVLRSTLAGTLIPALLLASFYIVHKRLIPTYQKDQNKLKLFFLAFLVLAASFAGVTLLHHMKQHVYTPIPPVFISSLILYSSYLIIVFNLNRFLISANTTDYRVYNYFRLFVIFVLLAIFLGTVNDHHIPDWIIFIVLVLVPGISILLVINYFFIYLPKVKGKRKKSRIAYFLIPILIASLIFLFGTAAGVKEVLIVGPIIGLVLLIVVNPLTNFFFSKYHGYLAEITSLNIQLEETSSNLKQLIHQINPHFLFNTLNTLYGIALKEKATKTADSIQKLGDMMRLMLKENEDESIPLENELDYLKNYIDLQKLRIRDSKKIEISFNISEGICTGNIAPMLMIPFVENAFKYGISLNKKSWVKVNLRCEDGTIYLDVNNSNHKDSREDKSEDHGIGIDNVRRRLELLYPDNHELVIRENDTEFFVHLTVKLKDH